MKRLLVLIVGLFTLGFFYSNAADTTKYVGSQTFYLSGGGISSTATTVPLTSFRLPQRNYELSIADFGTTIYATIENGKSKQESVTCTGVIQSTSTTDYTASLTGCTRGLLPFSPYTASSTYAFPHSGGSSVVVSDTPQFLTTFANLLNDESVTGSWTFAIANPPRYASTPTLTGDLLAFASVGYANAIAAQGVATSSESSGGIVELATQTETASGTVFSVDGPHVMQSRYATSSPYGTAVSGLMAVISKANGKISQLWLDLAEAFTWTGAHIFNGTVTMNATTTLAEVTVGTNSIALTASTTMTGASTPQPVYIASSTNPNAGGALIVDGNDINTLDFIGFAVTNAATGTTVYIQKDGIVNGFTGLTKGATYYVSDTAGVLATTAGTYEVKVGVAVSATELLVEKRYAPVYKSVVAQWNTANASATTTYTHSLGYTPKKITVTGLCPNGASNGGETVGTYINGTQNYIYEYFDQQGNGSDFIARLLGATDYVTGTLINVNGETVDIAWVKYGSPTTVCNIIIEAEG